MCDVTMPIPTRLIFLKESSLKAPLLAAEGFMIQKILIQGVKTGAFSDGYAS